MSRKTKSMIIGLLLIILLVLASILFIQNKHKDTNNSELPTDNPSLENIVSVNDILNDNAPFDFNNSNVSEDQKENFEILKNREESEVDKEFKNSLPVIISKEEAKIIGENISLEIDKQALFNGSMTVSNGTANTIRAIGNEFYHTSYYSYTKGESNPAFEQLLQKYNINTTDLDYYMFTYSPDENKFFVVISDETLRDMQLLESIKKLFSDALGITITDHNWLYNPGGQPRLLVAYYSVDTGKARLSMEKVFLLYEETYGSAFGQHPDDL